jgi:hypothetical protein
MQLSRPVRAPFGRDMSRRCDTGLHPNDCSLSAKPCDTGKRTQTHDVSKVSCDDFKFKK